MAEDIYRREVLELHQFLDAWLKGEVPKGGGRPERLAQALVASALLRRRADGRGIEWLFLQETLAPHLEQEGQAAR